MRTARELDQKEAHDIGTNGRWVTRFRIQEEALLRTRRLIVMIGKPV